MNATIRYPTQSLEIFWVLFTTFTQFLISLDLKFNEDTKKDRPHCSTEYYRRQFDVKARNENTMTSSPPKNKHVLLLLLTSFLAFISSIFPRLFVGNDASHFFFLS